MQVEPLRKKSSTHCARFHTSLWCSQLRNFCACCSHRFHDTPACKNSQTVSLEKDKQIILLMNPVRLTNLFEREYLPISIPKKQRRW